MAIKPSTTKNNKYRSQQASSSRQAVFKLQASVLGSETSDTLKVREDPERTSLSSNPTQMTPISNLQLPAIAQVSFSAGRLAYFRKHWLTVPNVTRTVKSITSGYKLPFTSYPPHTICENKSFSSEKMIQLEDY